jgi:hypothetical protein
MRQIKVTEQKIQQQGAGDRSEGQSIGRANDVPGPGNRLWLECTDPARKWKSWVAREGTLQKDVLQKGEWRDSS